jgi:hypothetical protein
VANTLQLTEDVPRKVAIAKRLHIAGFMMTAVV